MLPDPLAHDILFFADPNMRSQASVGSQVVRSLFLLLKFKSMAYGLNPCSFNQ